MDKDAILRELLNEGAGTIAQLTLIETKFVADGRKATAGGSQGYSISDDRGPLGHDFRDVLVMWRYGAHLCDTVDRK